MSFKSVIMALTEQLKNDDTLSKYIPRDRFYIGFKENIPGSEYVVVLEPGPEIEKDRSSAGPLYKEIDYSIDIYDRLIIPNIGTEGVIIGKRSKKGLLEVVEDVKNCIRANKELDYDTPSYSKSAKKTSGTYVLDPTKCNITVKIKGIERSGYTTINCGEASLSGTIIATNIQAAIRTLGTHEDDGYTNAVCIFDSSENQFTIEAGINGPVASVEVSEGATNDCSSILGFDNSIEELGTNIVDVKFGVVSPFNDLFPVRYRIVPVIITEEIKIR